ncbi:hypothetical protein Goarm_017086, partial [Gossypium armourianum]|nr:hypothetical protein [Gossypium armourianum]
MYNLDRMKNRKLSYLSYVHLSALFPSMLSFSSRKTLL